MTAAVSRGRPATVTLREPLAGPATGTCTPGAGAGRARKDTSRATPKARPGTPAGTANAPAATDLGRGPELPSVDRLRLRAGRGIRCEGWCATAGWGNSRPGPEGEGRPTGPGRYARGRKAGSALPRNGRGRRHRGADPRRAARTAGRRAAWTGERAGDDTCCPGAGNRESRGNRGATEEHQQRKHNQRATTLGQASPANLARRGTTLHLHTTCAGSICDPGHPAKGRLAIKYRQPCHAFFDQGYSRVLEQAPGRNSVKDSATGTRHPDRMATHTRLAQVR